jgi:steroid delta-isomerase-like uncharacterized protein
MQQKIMFLWLGLAILICIGGSQSMVGAQTQPRAGAVSLEQNKALVRRWIEEGFNKQGVKVIDDLFVEDFIVNGRKIGREGLRQSMNRHLTAFPDLHVMIAEIIAEGDKVVIWYTVQGTHKGEFDGVPPTGKQVDWFGADLFRIAGGKIVEARFVDDSLGRLRQLGATVSPPPVQ